MISSSLFTNLLSRHGIDFYTGVPDSLLGGFCSWIGRNVPSDSHVVAANEGAAVALAAGHYLATGHPACVYMQNSGEGNAVNPLASLTDSDVYAIPVLLLIGWRGCPGTADEPQHVKQGKITLPLLEVLGLSYGILTDDENLLEEQISRAFTVLSSGRSYALVVRKNTFVPCNPADGACMESPSCAASDFEMSREEAIRLVADAAAPSDIIVSSTGMISRELYEYREASGAGHERDFLTVGSMGHANQIALGIAMGRKERRVWCFDGDGAVIMHMGSLAIVASRQSSNLIHVIFNNGAHDSVGGQPTVGLQIDLAGVARSVGYKTVFSVSTRESLVGVLRAGLRASEGPVFLEVKVRKGNRANLGRPVTTPVQNRDALTSFLKSKTDSD